MPLPPWSYFRSITDSTGGSLAGAVCKIALTSANFDFSLANPDGSDLRVYDETAAALVPHWRMDYDPVAQTATVYYKATLTSHTHSLYYGNPSRTDTSLFSGVFTHGTGFDSDWGDVTTNVVGATAAAIQYPGPTSTSDPRNYLFWRLQENPTLSLSDLTTAGIPASSYTGIREFNLIRDSQNRVLKIGSLYYATFSRRPSVNTLTIDPWIASSTSSAGPWSNFTQMWPTGAEHLNYSSSPIKIGSTYYTFVTFGWANGGSQTPGLVVKLRTSTDLTTWADKGTILSPGVFNDVISGVCTDIGNPWVTPLADGSFLMTVEGYNSVNAKWSCYGATCAGPPFTTWTPLNSGNPLIAKGAGGTWDANGVANPKALQMPDGTIVIEYNGSDDAANLDWQLGFATAATPAGPYTKNAANPIAGHISGTYGCETAHFSWDENGTDYFHACQRFDTASNTAHAFFLYQEQRQGGLLLERAADNTDAAVAGVVLSAGTFTAGVRSALLAHRTFNTSQFAIGLYDSATVPTPTASGSWTAGRRLEITRNAHDSTTPGDLSIDYWDGSAVRHFWTGSAWTTTSTKIAADHAREIVARIQDDGTNYILSATYADDGTSIASASIVKTSVATFASGRVLYAGEPFNDLGLITTFYRYFMVRPYVATEPILSLGAKQLSPATGYTITPPSPASGYANNASGNFTITPNGVYNASITITPNGGFGLSTIGFTWTNSATPFAFTITPNAAGQVVLTPTNSGGLTDPAPATYTSNAQGLSVNPAFFTVSVPVTATLTGTGTLWLSSPPSPTITGAAASGTALGTVTVNSATSATVLVTPGTNTGSLVFHDASTTATATTTVSAPASPSGYLSKARGLNPGLVGSVGYTVLRSDSTVYAARSTVGVFSIGTVGYAALVSIPISGSYIILWDDGLGHFDFEVLSPAGVEPPSTAFPIGLNEPQMLSMIWSTICGLTAGYTGIFPATVSFKAPDGATVRVTGRTDGLGNRVAPLMLNPPL